MRKVLVSQNIVNLPERSELRDTLDLRLTQFLLNCGLLAYPVPNAFGSKIMPWLKGQDFDAVILSGGNDLGEYKQRENLEDELLKFALQNDIPVIGICRGMLKLVHYSGGRVSKVEHHAGKRHTIVGKLNRQVNSYHNFSVSSLPKNLLKLAVSATDHSIEAIYDDKLNWYGCMWHPEREKMFENEDIYIFKTVSSKAKLIF